MNLLEQAADKYGHEDRESPPVQGDWQSVAVELRMHPPGELPQVTLEHMEIGVATRAHRAALVDRTGDGMRQITPVRSGTIWLCPMGVHERDIRLVEWHEVLHVYLPPSSFDRLEDFTGGSVPQAAAMRYLADVEDDLIRSIAGSLHAEMVRPTAGGKVLADALSLALTARLAQTCCEGGALADPPPRTGMDERRLRRVVEYMSSNLEQDLSLSDLADVACLSPFHFSRMFRARTGVPPHKYLGSLRLERAKALLREGQTVSAVAAACRFSSPSNFIRAFRRATGTTPALYRAGFSSTQSAVAVLPRRGG